MKTPLAIRNVRRRTLLVLAGLLVLGTSVSAAAPTGSAPSFAPARSYETGRDPRSVAIGDLNGDGKPDLAIANYRSNTASVLLNSGDGSFRAKRDYGTDYGPHSVAIGDLNGDGRPDLAIANNYVDFAVGETLNTVSVLVNRGDGSFRAKRDYASGRGAFSVAIGDLNGDGKPDLATANVSAHTVSVLLNRGDGSFQAKLDYSTGRSPESVAIGDLNGDRRPDLATANFHSNTVSVLVNEGNGSFRAKFDYATNRGPLSVAIGDLNGDGKPDLATANVSAKTVSVLLNRGDGSFRAEGNYGTGRGPGSITIGDLTGDGRPDLVTANFLTVTVSVFLNRGGGSFRAKLDYRSGPYPHSVAIGDLNGDGRPDLAIDGESKTVSVLLNRPGLCTVQDVEGQRLPAAKRTIARANCRTGKIRRAFSKWFKKGRVISEKPKPGTVLPGGGKVNLVVSRGRKH